MNLHLNGGSAGSSRRETKLSPRLSAKALDTTIELTSMGFEEAYTIDEATGTTFWRNAIEKEMKNVCVAFDILVDSAAPPPDHQNGGFLVQCPAHSRGT
jgi:hypothetical protein